jgi:cobalt/nickel transport system ATP-binding protein
MSHYAALDIAGLHFRYPDGTAALNGVNLHVHEGDRVGLLGANGAGKSTLLLHLNGIHIPESGTVSVFGIAVQKKTLREVRQRIGLIFQNPDDQLFCPTLYDDIAFGPRQMGMSEHDVRHRVDHAVEEAGLNPDLLQKNVYHLSFGQKKLASIATVLAMDARILVFDEPTIGLDPRARKSIMRLLRRIGRTQIVASHDFGLLRDTCTRVAVLHKGVVSAEGAPAQILDDDLLLKRNDLS